MCNLIDQLAGGTPGSDITAGASGYVPGPGDFTSGASGYMPGTDYYTSGFNSDYSPGPMFSAIPSSGGGGGSPAVGGGAPAAGGGGGIGNTMKGVWDVAKPFLPIAGAMLGAKSQENMYKNLGNAQQQSYQQYLTNLNPPEPVKQAMYQKAVNQILPTANLNSRKIYNELASRGVRGGGLASPTAGMERDVTKAKQNAYLDIYGRYNVPQITPPVAYTPGTSNIIGSNVGDIGTALMLKQMFS